MIFLGDKWEDVGIGRFQIIVKFRADDESKFVVIDIETGAYEIDADEVAASDRLLARYPNAQIWLRQVGSRYARRFGPRQRAVV